MMAAPRIAVVTDATSGIGRATALRLSRDGFHIVACGRDPDPAAAIVASIEAAGGSARFHALDVVSEADWAALAQRIEADHGRFDALVNCAGGFLSRSLPDTTLGDFQSLWTLDVESVLLGTKYGLRAMRDTFSGGSIVNISSLAGLIGLEDCAAYCAAKAAVTHLSRVAALEGAAFSPPVRVNSLNPGVIRTETVTGSDSAVRACAIEGNALQRAGKAADIASAAAYLAGPASRMVTGTAMVVDGGRGAD